MARLAGPRIKDMSIDPYEHVIVKELLTNNEAAESDNRWLPREWTSSTSQHSRDAKTEN